MLIIGMAIPMRAGAIVMVALTVFLATMVGTHICAAHAAIPAHAMVRSAATSSGLFSYYLGISVWPTSMANRLVAKVPNAVSRAFRPARGRRRDCGRWGTACPAPSDARSVVFTPEVE